LRKKKGSFLSKIRSRPKPKVDKELASLMEAVQDDPADMRLRLKLADNFLKREERLKALDQYLTIAETFAERAIYPKAVAVYKRALDIDPQMIEVYIKLAQQYQKLGLMSEVVTNYTKAAEIHEKAGRKKEALDTFRMLIELSQENAVGRLKLGQQYLNEGFHEDAIREFLKASEIFKHQKKTEERRKLFEGLLERGIEDVKIIQPLFETFTESHDYNSLMDWYAKLKTDLSGSVAIQGMLAESAKALGRTDVALDALGNIAGLYDSLGRPDKVKETCEEILSLDPENESAVRMLAAQPKELPPDISEGVEEIPEGDLFPRPSEEESEEGEVVVELEEEDLEEIPEPSAPVEEIEESPPPPEEIKEIAEEEVDLFAAEGEEFEVEEVYEEELPEPPETEEAEPGISLPDVDYDALSPDETAAHIALVRGIFTEADQPEGFGEFLDGLHEDRPKNIPVLEAMRNLALESGDEETATNRLLQLADAAQDAGLTDRLGSFLEELHRELPDDIHVQKRLANFVAETDPEKAIVQFTHIARGCLDEGDFAGAEESLGRILDIDSDNIGAHQEILRISRKQEDEEKIFAGLRRLAKTHLDLGDADAARPLLEEAVGLRPEDEGTREDLLSTFGALKEPGGAIRFLGRLGKQAVEEGRNEEAESFFERILALDGKDLAARNELKEMRIAGKDVPGAIDQLRAMAEIGIKNGEPEKAEAYLREAVSLDPSSAKVHEDLIDFFESRGQSEQAAGELEILAESRSADGAEEEAGILFERALALAPERADLRRNYVDFLRRAGRENEAIENLFLLAAGHGRADQLDRTETALREVLSLDSSNRRAHRELKDMYISLGREDKAVIELFSLAELVRKDEDGKAALTHFGEIVGLDPDNVEAHEGIKAIHLAAEDTDAAVGEMVAIAGIQERRGQADEAGETLRHVLKLRPDDHEAFNRLTKTSSTKRSRSWMKSSGSTAPTSKPAGAKRTFF